VLPVLIQQYLDLQAQLVHKVFKAQPVRQVLRRQCLDLQVHKDLPEQQAQQERKEFKDLPVRKVKLVQQEQQAQQVRQAQQVLKVILVILVQQARKVFKV
jgi:hypothetical protein